MLKVDTSGFMAAMKAATEKLAEAVGEKTLRQVGFAGAEIFRDQAKINASNSESVEGQGPARRTGTIYNNIIAKRLEEEGSDTRQAYLVTVRTGKFGSDGDAYYWRWVESGHKFVGENKNISAKTGKKVRWKAHRAKAELAAKARRMEFGTSGAPAYPFMRPAYESKKQEAIDAMTAKLSEILKERSGEL